jgi:salicylate hydroxylase
MAIESGIALATILRYWKNNDLNAAFQFYKDLRKPRTDRITQTSYEVGRLASAQDPDSLDDKFNPGAMRERMRWIMDYDVLADLWARNEVAQCMESSQEAENRPIHVSL